MKLLMDERILLKNDLFYLISRKIGGVESIRAFIKLNKEDFKSRFYFLVKFYFQKENCNVLLSTHCLHQIVIV